MYREADGMTTLPYVTDHCTVRYELDDGTPGSLVIRRDFEPGAATPGSPWGSALIGKQTGQEFQVRITAKSRKTRIINGKITLVTR